MRKAFCLVGDSISDLLNTEPALTPLHHWAGNYNMTALVIII